MRLLGPGRGLHCNRRIGDKRGGLFLIIKVVLSFLPTRREKVLILHFQSNNSPNHRPGVQFWNPCGRQPVV
jgi:hypothetical protein